LCLLTNITHFICFSYFKNLLIQRYKFNVKKDSEINTKVNQFLYLIVNLALNSYEQIFDILLKKNLSLTNFNIGF